MSIHALESLWPVSALPEFPAAATRAFERMLLVEDIR